MSWVLVLVLVTGATDGGRTPVRVERVERPTQAACISAMVERVSARDILAAACLPKQ